MGEEHAQEFTNAKVVEVFVKKMLSLFPLLRKHCHYSLLPLYLLLNFLISFTQFFNNNKNNETKYNKNYTLKYQTPIKLHLNLS